MIASGQTNDTIVKEGLKYIVDCVLVRPCFCGSQNHVRKPHFFRIRHQFH